MKRKLHRIVAFGAAAVLTVSAAAMLAGCTSSNPEVTITYSFNGNTYEVEYKLSRSDAPQTTQHFIDLADAGYYDGTCIHNYTSTAMYGGGYTFEDGELKEKDYFAEVTKLEAEGHPFSQSVYYVEDGEKTPLYTVYGEFEENHVVNEAGRENTHSRGALVMYYTDKSTAGRNIQVTVERNDGGKNNDGGDKEQTAYYSTNSATSLFYTYLGASNTSLDSKYAVFGKAKYYDDQLKPLLDAIDAYKGTLVDDEETADIDESNFTEVRNDIKLDTLDHHADIEAFAKIAQYFESVRKGGVTETFYVPREMPIIIESVKVTKY